MFGPVAGKEEWKMANDKNDNKKLVEAITSMEVDFECEGLYDYQTCRLCYLGADSAAA